MARVKYSKMLQSFLVKGAGVNNFCERSVSAKKDPDKRRCCHRFDLKILRQEEGL